MSTPEHIKRIIERLEPVDQVAMEAYLAEMEGVTKALLAANRTRQEERHEK